MIVQGQTGLKSTADPRSEEFVAGLSQLLRNRGLLDDLAVRRAQRAQSQSGERFDLVLIRLGLIPEADLAKVLAELLGLPFIDGRDLPDVPLLADKLQPPFLKTNRILPLRDQGDRIVVAVADPFAADAVNSISFLLGRPVECHVGPVAEIERAIERLYGGETGASGLDQALRTTADLANEEDVRRLEDLASEAPVIRLVHDLIARAVEMQASDIHVEPREDCVRVRFRLDGMLQTVETLPLDVRPAMTSRIKIMAQLNIAERRLPQDGRIKSTVRGREIDLRISTMPTLRGESIVLRILDRSSVDLDFAALGLVGPTYDAFAQLLELPNGIILVTGPTGSGKTTTLYTALRRLNRTESKLFTVEDPIEYQLAGVNQIQVQPRIGLNFATALRSILRQDPDIIMVGEIRDVETAQVAIQASLTGHLVLSTVHTNSAAATVTRLIDMGLEDYLLASSLKGVLAQRLVRRLCPSCSVPAELPPSFIARLKDGGRDPHRLALHGKHNFRQKGACQTCRNTGFQGRTCISELLVVSDLIRSRILANDGEAAIASAAISEGMTALLDDGLAKAFRGETTIDEVLRARFGRTTAAFEQLAQHREIWTLGAARYGGQLHTHLRQARELHRPAGFVHQHRVAGGEQQPRDDIQRLRGPGRGDDLLRRGGDAQLAQAHRQRGAQPCVARRVAIAQAGRVARVVGQWRDALRCAAAAGRASRAAACRCPATTSCCRGARTCRAISVVTSCGGALRGAAPLCRDGSVAGNAARTKKPRCWRASAKPCACSRSYAATTVLGASAWRRADSRTDGSRVPLGMAGLRMSWRSMRRTAPPRWPVRRVAIPVRQLGGAICVGTDSNTDNGMRAQSVTAVSSWGLRLAAMPTTVPATSFVCVAAPRTLRA